MAAVRLADPLYFLDENMESADLADLLTAAGLSCIRISKAGAPFRTHMTDEQWIPLVAARGWWGVTRDSATLTNTGERAAIVSSRAVHLVLRGKALRIQEMAAALITAHNVLCVKIPKLTRPAILYIHRDGQVDVKVGERRGGARK
jgi:hypothetical protein